MTTECCYPMCLCRLISCVDLSNGPVCIHYILRYEKKRNTTRSKHIRKKDRERNSRAAFTIPQFIWCVAPKSCCRVISFKSIRIQFVVEIRREIAADSSVQTVDGCFCINFRINSNWNQQPQRNIATKTISIIIFFFFRFLTFEKKKTFLLLLVMECLRLLATCNDGTIIIFFFLFIYEQQSFVKVFRVVSV